MKFLILIVLMIPQWSFAHCPTEIEFNSQKYCLGVQFVEAQKKNKSQLEDTQQMSPYLIPMGEKPQKWLYSQAEIRVWADGDKDHAPVVLDGLRVFPYMHMSNGHHHGASYDFTLDSAKKTYLLKSIAFHQMKGCWTLRWTVNKEDSLENSQFVMELVDFENLNKEQNASQALFCVNVPDKVLQGSKEEGSHSH